MWLVLLDDDYTVCDYTVCDYTVSFSRIHHPHKVSYNCIRVNLCGASKLLPKDSSTLITLIYFNTSQNYHAIMTSLSRLCIGIWK